MVDHVYVTVIVTKQRDQGAVEWSDGIEVTQLQYVCMMQTGRCHRDDRE